MGVCQHASMLLLFGCCRPSARPLLQPVCPALELVWAAALSCSDGAAGCACLMDCCVRAASLFLGTRLIAAQPHCSNPARCTMVTHGLYQHLLVPLLQTFRLYQHTGCTASAGLG
jgi:hypothetical protein